MNSLPKVEDKKTERFLAQYKEYESDGETVKSIQRVALQISAEFKQRLKNSESEAVSEVYRALCDYKAITATENSVSALEFIEISQCGGNYRVPLIIV